MADTINDERLAFDKTERTPSVRFLASLSDGRTVIQDDRPKERAAWARLAEWLKDNPDVSITEVRLQGPGGIDFKTPPNQKGYFFGNKHQGVQLGPQYNFIGIGYYDGHKVHVVWYKQPKFDNATTEERTVANAGFLLIRNP